MLENLIFSQRRHENIRYVPEIVQETRSLEEGEKYERSNSEIAAISYFEHIRILRKYDVNCKGKQIFQLVGFFLFANVNFRYLKTNLYTYKNYLYFRLAI